jgi:hypothetical protein
MITARGKYFDFSVQAVPGVQVAAPAAAPAPLAFNIAKILAIVEETWFRDRAPAQEMAPCLCSCKPDTAGLTDT